MTNPSNPRASMGVRILLALLFAVVMALLGAALWSLLPFTVGMQLGVLTSEELGYIFFILGSPAGLIAGAVSGFITGLVGAPRLAWRRFLILLAVMAALGVALGVWVSYT
jgi:hypothetical protein